MGKVRSRHSRHSKKKQHTRYIKRRVSKKSHKSHKRHHKHSKAKGLSSGTIAISHPPNVSIVDRLKRDVDEAHILYSEKYANNGYKHNQQTKKLAKKWLKKRNNLQHHQDKLRSMKRRKRNFSVNILPNINT